MPNFDRFLENLHKDFNDIYCPSVLIYIVIKLFKNLPIAKLFPFIMGLYIKEDYILLKESMKYVDLQKFKDFCKIQNSRSCQLLLEKIESL